MGVRDGVRDEGVSLFRRQGRSERGSGEHGPEHLEPVKSIEKRPTVRTVAFVHLVAFPCLIWGLSLRSKSRTIKRVNPPPPRNMISRTAAPPSAPGGASQRPRTRCPRHTTAPSALGSAGSSGPRRRSRPGCTTARWVSSTGATLSRR